MTNKRTFFWSGVGLGDVKSALQAAQQHVVQEMDVHERYHVKYEQEISRNGDTVVRKCIDRATGERMDIRSTYKLGQQSIDDLRNEAVLLAGFEHPNILGVREVFEDDKHLHIVTERCKGGELYDLLFKKARKGEYFSEVEAAAVVYQLLLAVSYLHHKAFVHRDIKLDGIFLKSKNVGDLSLRICNFSAATGYNPKVSRPMNARVGTTFSIAPEVLRGSSYTNKCDIWAVGVIGYALMCGKAPFQATHDLDPLELVKSDKVVEFPKSDWAGVSELAKAFLRRCLNKEPGARPSVNLLLGHPWIAKMKPDFVGLIDVPPPSKRRILGKGFLSRRSRLKEKSSRKTVASSARISMTGSVNMIPLELV